MRYFGAAGDCKKEMKNIKVKLFLTFSKIGLFTFGGGYAMLPMLQRECCQNNKWATEEELLDYFAIGQCTPGIIAVNTATFIGHSISGISGAIWATLGVVFPSFLIISLLASLLRIFQNNMYFIKAFAGIRLAVCALILNSVYKMAKKGLNDWLTILTAIAVLFSELFFNISPVLIVLAVFAESLLFYLSGRSEKP